MTLNFIKLLLQQSSHQYLIFNKNPLLHNSPLPKEQQHPRVPLDTSTTRNTELKIASTLPILEENFDEQLEEHTRAAPLSSSKRPPKPRVPVNTVGHRNTELKTTSVLLHYH
ncbi:hypothetical protein L195_g035742 [Trifolium pratense]|uniref:Uncharacterized protein n=2 Tax=Trifolium pratense TaxID=57577 RepID=A0A2K3LMK4_TRIPR|nr:hypothetical protein L195_g035742 [Trifolium pratense]